METNMETQEVAAPSLVKTALQFGLYTGLSLVVYSLLLIITGLDLNTVLGFVSFAILIVGIVLALKAFRQQNGGLMTYGQGLGAGALVSLVVGVLVSLFSVIYSFYIDPSQRERQLKYTVEQSESMMKKFNAPDGDIDTAIEKIREDFNNTGPAKTFFSGMLTFAIIGGVLSLIIAAIMKKSPQVFE